MEKKNALPARFPYQSSDELRQAGFKLAAMLLTLIFLTTLVVQPAFAGGGGLDFYVATTGVDSGNCLISPCRTIAYTMTQTLSGDRIHMAAGIYVENLIPTKNLTFYGAGMNATILDGGGLNVVIDDTASNLAFQDLTIRNGYHSGGNSGGGIAHWGGTLTLTRVKVTGNRAHNGGGIISSGPLIMTDCVVSANSAETYDTAGGYGGGVFLQGSGVSANLVNTTISGNTATGSSGGLHNQRTGTVNLLNVTLSGNTAKNNGAISSTNSSILALTNSTIADNHFSAGGSNGGIGNYATLNFKNTLVAWNDGTNCFNSGSGTLNTLGGNLESANTCSFTHLSDYRDTDPHLGSLADNGGPTETRALLTGSYAIDGGIADGCTGADQRGVLRPQDGNHNGIATCDIGAYELVFAPFGDILVMNSGAWNKYDFASGGYLSGVWTGTAAGCTPVLIDYDGDGVKEYSQLCGGAWHFYNKNGSYNKGIWVGDFPGSIPVPGDYVGDGTDEPVLFYAGAWHFFDFATGAYDAALSRWTGTAPGCVPAPEDYNGDGKMEFSLFCGGPWHFYNSDGSYNKGIWIGGSTSNIPAPADYDGNGTEEVVVFASGVWHFFDFATGAYNAAKSTYTGLAEASAKPAPIDYYKDGTLDFVQYANGTWYFYNANGSFNKSIATGSPASAVPMTRRFLP